MPKNREILTAREVADYLNIHLLTVHRYAREGKIPAFKIGTDWRFHRKYIDRWIKEKSFPHVIASPEGAKQSHLSFKK